MAGARYPVLLLTVLLAGCTTITRLPPPENLNALSDIPGMPEVRFWGDETAPANAARIETLRRQITSAPDYDPNAPVCFLALSGGGQKGAFGAGLLTGWTASGTRPRFRMVTGISTGALIAPFAFLGPEYDEAIRKMYTRFSTKDVLDTRLLSGVLAGDAVTDNTPLREIVKSCFTPAEIQRVAQEHALGRRLLIGTTFLDVQRPVIWDIGAIASSGDPRAYDLIIDVLLASSAIPGAFPPVYFKVEQNGSAHDELHVDGGVTSQIFIAPPSFNMAESLKQAGLFGPAHVYLILNNQMVPAAVQVKPKTIPILMQSLVALLHAQGQGDLYRIYQCARLNHMEYHATGIPASFRAEPKEPFDMSYMTELFRLGYELAVNGYPWDTAPPSFDNPSVRGPQ